jgi:hypothetical protein
MFDADTVALIRGAPALEGLNLEALPQLLTNAFATIVTTRTRLRALPDETNEVIARMRKLAFAQEAYVAALPAREDRAAAAFVAAAAHHVCLLADDIRFGEGMRASRLSMEAISPEISAALLFLIAEASADAAEMAKAVRVEDRRDVEAAVLHAVADLACGRLREILNAPIPAINTDLDDAQSALATSSLYLMLLNGLRALAGRLLYPPALRERDQIGRDPNALFEEVKSLCIEPLSGLFSSKTTRAYSIYAGPLHLASLLSSAAQDLNASALVETPPPNGIDAGKWHSVIGKMAQRRPYLWRNHREAIAAGYLNPGISAAISFPTGGENPLLLSLRSQSHFCVA